MSAHPCIYPARSREEALEICKVLQGNGCTTQVKSDRGAWYVEAIPMNAEEAKRIRELNMPSPEALERGTARWIVPHRLKRARAALAALYETLGIDPEEVNEPQMDLHLGNHNLTEIAEKARNTTQEQREAIQRAVRQELIGLRPF